MEWQIESKAEPRKTKQASAKLRGLPGGAPPNEESYHKPETTSSTSPALNPQTRARTD